MAELCVSRINPQITLEYLKTASESKYFDRKSAQVKVAELAPIISAFANADGGTIAIGISDKRRILEGINAYAEEKINSFVNAPRDCCKPMPKYQTEFLNITNEDGEPDRILLLHISESVDQVIRTVNDETWLRIGDRTKEMLGENLRNLEYVKSTRHYEDEINQDAEIADLDEELLTIYKERINAKDINTEQLLRARGFMKEQDGKEYLTNAAVLLFSKDIYRFYPNCRVRFIRYDGNFAQVGTDINIIRDYSIELPLLRIIDKTREFVATQLREFTALNVTTGRFQIVPEYPEYAWLEGIVNAVTHREYAMSGDFIKVCMYDDRLEIESPRKLPNVVTVDNIRETRYSRNPRISRVLTEFGWVRELNEGVKRIYSDMEKFFLDDPIYTESDHSVCLILKNNIVMRRLRQKDRTEEKIGEDIWGQTDELEKAILTYITSRGEAGREELVGYTGSSSRTVSRRLAHLMEIDAIKKRGNPNSPKSKYVLVYKND